MLCSKAFAIAFGILTLIIPRETVVAAELPINPAAEGQDVIWGKKVVEGGYILHFRHANREKWIDVTAFDAIELLKNYEPDAVPFKRATCLSEQGVHEAQLMGSVFEAARVQLETIISSPSCRSRQTAQHAFGRIDMISNSLLHRTAIPARQHLAFNTALRKLILNSQPTRGKNTILSGHAGTLRLDSGIVIDRNETGEGLDERDETGFVVLEVVGDQIIARHKFRSIMYFAHDMLELPVTRDDERITENAD